MNQTNEIALLRQMDPGVVIPGVDVAAGNPLAVASLTPVAAMRNTAGVFYVPSENEVVVNQSGAILSGYNFGSATIYVNANNVTIKDSTFQSGPTEFYSMDSSGSGTTIEDNTFNGGSPTNLSPMQAFIGGTGSMSVLGNAFYSAPGNDVNIESGTVSGNYMSGGGYSSSGKHPDLIWVPATTGALAIENNFVNATFAPGATSVANGETSYALQLTPVDGNISNVVVRDNFLLGGTYSVDVAAGSTYGYSNVSISNNYTGFGQGGQFYPGTPSGVTEADNTAVDYFDPIWFQQAWAAYLTDGVETHSLQTATAPSQQLRASAADSTTLYGGGQNCVYMYGSSNETVYIGGSGLDYMWGGSGSNIYTFLTMGGASDSIGNFNVNKDVIDLSAIDASVTGADEPFTFIGTSPFTSAGAEVGYYQDRSANVTYVEATLAGELTPDFEIRMSGLLNLTAADFALTPAQSAADMAAGVGGASAHALIRV
jgi:hypothetical protein